MEGRLGGLLLVLGGLLVLNVESSYGISTYCYYTSWAQYRVQPYNYYVWDIDPTLCTHISYAFATFNADFTVSAPHDNSEFEILRTKRDSVGTMKLIMAVGGWTEGSTKFSAMVSSPEHRSTFITSFISLVKAIRFDGLELDWEYPAHRNDSSPADKDNFSLLLQELRTEADKDGLIVVVATAGGQSVAAAAYNIADLYSYADIVSIITYDYFDPKRLSYSAPLYQDPAFPEFESVNSTWQWYKDQGAVASKTLMGIPLYGHSFTMETEQQASIGDPAAGPGREGAATKEPGILAAYEVCAYLNDPDAVYTYNATLVASSLVVGDQWITADNNVTIQAKIEWMVSQGLQGVMVWSLDMDTLTRHTMCPNAPFNYVALEFINNVLADYRPSTEPPTQPQSTVSPGSSKGSTVKDPSAPTQLPTNGPPDSQKGEITTPSGAGSLSVTSLLFTGLLYWLV